jgi:hypothetical protein
MVDREDIKALAHIIAKDLLSDLRSKKLEKIGIEEIRLAIVARTNQIDARIVFVSWNNDDLDTLEELTTRAIVESAA